MIVMTASGTRLAMLALATFLAGNASADTPAVLAASCANCHGPDGRSPGEIPSIDALDAQAMAAQLREFRSGEREATVMNRIARGYTDAEIDALVEYFTARQP